MIKAISKRILRPLFSVGLVAVLFAILFLVLKNGIYISSMHFGGLKIERFYLKLNNKFLLRVGQLDIIELVKHKPNRRPPTIATIVRYIQYGMWAVDYFENITIQEIDIKPNIKAHVFFNGHRYEFTFPDMVSGQFDLQEKGRQELHLNINYLDSEPYHVHLIGQATYAKRTEQLNFKLQVSPTPIPNIRPSKLKISVQGLTDFKSVALRLSSNNIKHIDFLKPYFKPDKHQALQKWLFSNISFGGFFIKDAKLSLNFKDKYILKSLQKNLSVQAMVQNAHVIYNPKLPPILAKEVELEYKDSQLVITPKHITYPSMRLEGSQVVMSHFGPNSRLVASIKNAPSPAFVPVKDILKAYNINLPLSHFKPAFGADILLTMQFIPHAKPLLFVQGSVDIAAGSFALYNIPLSNQSAQVFLDISPTNKVVYVSTTHTRFQNMADTDNRVTLDFTHKSLTSQAIIHKIQINTNPAINNSPFETRRTILSKSTPILRLSTLPSLLAKGVDTLAFKNKLRQIIQAQNAEVFSQDIIYATEDNLPTLSCDLDFSKEKHITFNIKELEIEGSIAKDYSLHLKNIAKLAAISPLAHYFAIKKGALKITTKDLKNFEFFGTNLDLELPLYRNDGRRFNGFSVLGTFGTRGLEFFTPDKAIMGRIRGGEKIIFANDINFNIDDFLKAKVPAIKELLNPSGKRPTKEQIKDETIFIREKQRYEKEHKISLNRLIIQAKNAVITFKGFPFALENILATMRDGCFRADASYHHASLAFDMAHGQLTLKANNFSGDYLNMVLQSIATQNIIQGGLYSLIGGYKDNVFSGELRLQNTTIKNFKLLQNVINLINTIPSLIVFRNPRLGANGYEISRGKVVFGVNTDYLGLEHIQLTGTTLDVDGSGIIELAKRRIDMSLNIATIKGFANVINKIPIVNYLILGGDGKISTHVNLKGSLDNPKANVTLAKDIFQAPFRILRRIFTPIDIIIEEIRKGMKDEPTRVPKKQTIHHP
ncbi:DUF3971 domain-containing protein [Helicobacter heilmannii]|uniref:Putative periplasmic protein n=1 Tax=Helicobacter heilmannii TaxID=35817 RepID=A0A0K2YB41_HELHE|nr:DUF3971 domain-containing protein [Helicobacter heilmannii]CRI34185.1 Putative periplasmic protein [Helicobacter heilmannii]